jgi:hypothetical protein
MVALAISLLWFLIGVIALCGVVWLVLYGISTFIYAIPPLVEKGIWFIVLLLVIIAALTLLAGGGSFHFPVGR